MKVLNVNYDSDYLPGCPTCDYGSRYIANFTIEYEDHSVNYRTEGCNGRVVSEGKLMTLLANATSEEEINDGIIQMAKDLIKNDKINYYSGSKLFIDNKEVNLDE